MATFFCKPLSQLHSRASYSAIVPSIVSTHKGDLWRCFARRQARRRRDANNVDTDDEVAGLEALPGPVGFIVNAPPPSDKPKEESDMEDSTSPGAVFLDRSKVLPSVAASDPASIADMPIWNPRTGFMTVSPPLPQTDASTSGRQSEVSQVQSQQQQAGAGQLPFVGRNTILSSCIKSGVGFMVLALLLHSYAETNIKAGPSVLRDLLSFPPGLTGPEDMLAMLAAMGLVTGARLALMQVWQDFRESTDRSNQQVLSPLGVWDIVVVAGMSGLSEELLFRGGIIPASWPDWRGVLLASLVFGVLHNSGGRNWSYAVWASAVGGVYGAAYLFTTNIWVPVLAHSGANFLSALIWVTRNQPEKTR